MITRVMNKMHSDSMKMIAQHWGKLDGVVSAKIVEGTLGEEGFDCEATLTGNSTKTVHISFPEPLDAPKKAEPLFVGMANDAASAITLPLSMEELKDVKMKSGVRRSQLLLHRAISKFAQILYGRCLTLMPLCCRHQNSG